MMKLASGPHEGASSVSVEQRPDGVLSLSFSLSPPPSLSLSFSARSFGVIETISTRPPSASRIPALLLVPYSNTLFLLPICLQRELHIGVRLMKIMKFRNKLCRHVVATWDSHYIPYQRLKALLKVAKRNGQAPSVGV